MAALCSRHMRSSRCFLDISSAEGALGGAAWGDRREEWRHFQPCFQPSHALCHRLRNKSACTSVKSRAMVCVHICIDNLPGVAGVGSGTAAPLPLPFAGEALPFFPAGLCEGRGREERRYVRCMQYWGSHRGSECHMQSLGSPNLCLILFSIFPLAAFLFFGLWRLLLLGGSSWLACLLYSSIQHLKFRA